MKNLIAILTLITGLLNASKCVAQAEEQKVNNSNYSLVQKYNNSFLARPVMKKVLPIVVTTGVLTTWYLLNPKKFIDNRVAVIGVVFIYGGWNMHAIKEEKWAIPLVASVFCFAVNALVVHYKQPYSGK